MDGPAAVPRRVFGNPLLLISWCLAGSPRRAGLRLGLAIAALVIAASSFVTLIYAPMIGYNEGQSVGFSRFEVGIFVWISAFVANLGSAGFGRRATLR